MYIENPDEEENKSQSSSSPLVGAGGGGAAVGSGGTSAGLTGGNPSTVNPVQTNQPNQSFANVQDYLKANQQQGENFGNQFVSTIGQGLGKSKSDIDTAAQNTQNEITGGTITANPDIINNISTSPTSITGDKDKLAEFQKEYNAQYTGPASFESSDQYTNAANAANQATQTGQELGTTGGREQLLQDKFGVYGQGNKGLDQTLLQNSSAYPNVPQLAQGFQSVQDYLKAASGTTNNAAQNAATTTQNTAQQLQNATTNAEKNFENTIGTNVTNAQQNAIKQQQQQQQEIAGATTLDQIESTLQKYGLTPDQVSIITNLAYNGLPEVNMPKIGLSDYITAPNPNTYTPYNTASLQDYLNSAALGQLNNNQSPYLPQAFQNQIGTAPKPGFNGQQFSANLLPYLDKAIDYWTKAAQASPHNGLDAMVNQYKNWRAQLQNIS